MLSSHWLLRVTMATALLPEVPACGAIKVTTGLTAAPAFYWVNRLQPPSILIHGVGKRL